MADYYPLIARAIAGLDPSAPGESRRALYERARAALIAQLRSVEPPLSESEITRERLSLEEAVRKVESEAAQRARDATRSTGDASRGPRAGDAFRATTRPASRPAADPASPSATPQPSAPPRSRPPGPPQPRSEERQDARPPRNLRDGPPPVPAAPRRRPTGPRERPMPMCRRPRRNSTGSSRTWKAAAPNSTRPIHMMSRS